MRGEGESERKRKERGRAEKETGRQNKTAIKQILIKFGRPTVGIRKVMPC